MKILEGIRVITILTIGSCGAILASLTFAAAMGLMPGFWYHQVIAIAGGCVGLIIGYFVAPWFGQPGWRGWATSFALGLGIAISGAGLVGMTVFGLKGFGIFFTTANEIYQETGAEVLIMVGSLLLSATVGGAIFGVGALFYSFTNPIVATAMLGSIFLIHIVAYCERHFSSKF